MEFELPEALAHARRKAREFALREITPGLARKHDLGEEYPDDLRKKAFASGILDYSDPWKMLVTMEEFCRVDAGTGIASVASLFGMELIMLFGTEEQRQQYLASVNSGQAIMGLAVTEASAGSDVAGIKTRAVKSGDMYILNGSKMFITNGQLADFLMVLTRTAQPDEKRHHGLSVFIVDMHSKGVSRNKLGGKLGVRATNTAEIILDNVEVPAKNLLGEEGKGFYYIMTFFNISRIYVAIQAVGIAQGALDRTLEIIERRGTGSVEAEKEQVLVTLGEMATRIEAARLLTYEAASRLFKFNPDPKLTSMAKAYAAETAVHVTEKALELTGVEGLGGDLERSFRDAKIMEIWEGTSEVEKLIIARTIGRERTKSKAEGGAA
ncbi:MAG: acyl-CoA dehydrogenase family protein [Nitrososphaerales archaeon]